MIDPHVLAELLADPSRAREVPRAEAVALLIELARVTRALELLTTSTIEDKQSVKPCDRMLSAREASRRTGMSTRWLYLHAAELPFAHRTSERAVRFSERGIERWKALKQSTS